MSNIDIAILKVYEIFFGDYMKKYIIAIILYLLNYIVIKGVIYCWNCIPIMPTDNKSTFMTYCTLGLFILEFLVFICSISILSNYINAKKN